MFALQNAAYRLTWGNNCISTRQIPDFLTRLFAYFDKSARSNVNDLGHEIKFSNQHIIRDLNWKPHSAEEAIVAMADSLIHNGAV